MDFFSALVLYSCMLCPCSVRIVARLGPILMIVSRNVVGIGDVSVQQQVNMGLLRDRLMKTAGIEMLSKCYPPKRTKAYSVTGN
jgi:hypothetical protein